MPLTVEQAHGRVPVTVLEIHGDLDYSNYREVIDLVQESYDCRRQASAHRPLGRALHGQLRAAWHSTAPRSS